MSSIIQKAFALEALLALPSAFALIFFPRPSLSVFLVSPWSGNAITPTTILFGRVTGAMILAVTAPLLYGIPDKSGVAEQRKSTYLTLGTAETVLVPLLLWEAFRATDPEKILSGGGFSRSVALESAASLLAILSWRSWVWALKPQWFGRSAEISEKGKTQ